MEFLAFLIVLIVLAKVLGLDDVALKAIKTHKSEPKVIGSPKTIYDCAVYSDRLFEQKLVAAGVMQSSEMSVCKDDRCENCKTLNPLPKSRLPISDAAKRRGTQIDHKSVRQQSQFDRIEQNMRRVYELKEQANEMRKRIEQTQKKIDYKKKRY